MIARFGIGPHPSDKNKGVARVGHPSVAIWREKTRARTTADPSTSLRKTSLWGGFAVSHPNDKNKDVVRMGHPSVANWGEKTKARTTADPSTSLRKTSPWGGFAVSHPNDKNKDVVRIGHPQCCDLGRENKDKNSRGSFDFAQESKSLGWVRGIPPLPQIQRRGVRLGPEGSPAPRLPGGAPRVGGIPCLRQRETWGTRLTARGRGLWRPGRSRGLR